MKRKKVLKLLLLPLFQVCRVTSSMCEALGNGLISGGEALLDTWNEVEWEWNKRKKEV